MLFRHYLMLRAALASLSNVIIQMYKPKVEPGSRSQMLQWINRTLNINETRIENLGTGVVYCMLVNHFHPHAINPSKIISIPRSPHDYRSNLRRLQEALSALDIKSITFDVFKVAEMTYSENWSLICKFYRQFANKQKIPLGESRWQTKSIESKLETSFNKPIMPLHSVHSVSVLPVSGLSTPMKGPKICEDNGNRWQTMSLIEEIKRIVSGEGVTDRTKVGQLRRLLGLQQEDGVQSQTQLKDLLSDYKKKEEVIQID